jgi:hypothetical protein
VANIRKIECEFGTLRTKKIHRCKRMQSVTSMWACNCFMAYSYLGDPINVSPRFKVV